MKHAALGFLLTVAVSAVVWFAWGVAAVPSAAIFGGVAAFIHVAAAGLLQPALVPPFERLVRRWAIGLGIRFAGVALLAVVLLMEWDRFPTLPTVVGCLGVLIPTLLSEMRMLLLTLQAGR